MYGTRLNIANLYEQHFCGVSRHTKELVKDAIHKYGKTHDLLSDAEIDSVFNIILGLLKIFGTEQYDGYLQATIKEKREIIKETVDKELYLYYKVSSKKRPDVITSEIYGTIYEPQAQHLIVTNYDGTKTMTKSKMFIAPQYILLLNKNAENYLSCASAKTNHYGFGIGASSKAKNLLSWKNSPTKILSETETRLYSVYCGPEALIEIKDRATNINSHAAVYKSILDADKPTCIEENIDRDVMPFGEDSSLEFVNNILNAAGVELTYVPEDNKHN